MKAIGTLMTFTPTNAFIDVVFRNNNGEFFSETKNGVIVNFYDVQIPEEDIYMFDNEYSVIKGDEEFLCFINEKNDRIYGFKSDIISDLIKILMNESDMHLLAKCEVAGEIELNGLIIDYLDNYAKQEESFVPDLEYFLVEEINDLNDDDDLYKKMVELDEKALKYNMPLDNLIAIKDDNFYFGNNKVEIDYFLNQTLSEKLPNAIQSQYKFYCDYDKSLYNILKKNSFIHCIKNSSLYKIAVNKDTFTTNKKLNNHLFRRRQLYFAKEEYESSISEDEKSYVIEDVNIENQMLDIYYSKSQYIEKNIDNEVLLKAGSKRTQNSEKNDGKEVLLKMGAMIIQDKIEKDIDKEVILEMGAEQLEKEIK